MLKIICPCQVIPDEVEGTVWSETLIMGVEYSKDSWHCYCDVCGKTYRVSDITEEISHVVKLVKKTVEDFAEDLAGQRLGDMIEDNLIKDKDQNEKNGDS